MQKRESFYAEMQEIVSHNWVPAPREYSTLTCCNQSSFLIGGQNFDTNKEVAQLIVSPFSNNCEWKNLEYTTNDEKLQGRCRHSACTFEHKLIIFGGSYMYSRKRQVRECTNQVLIFDIGQRTLNVIKTKGISVQPRKDHSAAIYGTSMIVYGGQFQNGAVQAEMLIFDLNYNDWNRLNPKLTMEPLMQATCCTVMANKKNVSVTGFELQRMSDAIFDGIYFFGGKNSKHEL